MFIGQKVFRAIPAVHQTSWNYLVAYNGSGSLALKSGNQVYTKKDGLLSDGIYAIRETRNGDLLIPAEAACRLHAGHFSNYDQASQFSPRQTLDVLEDDRCRPHLAAGQGGHEIEGEHVRIPFSRRSAAEWTCVRY